MIHLIRTPVRLFPNVVTHARRQFARTQRNGERSSRTDQVVAEFERLHRELRGPAEQAAAAAVAALLAPAAD